MASPEETPAPPLHKEGGARPARAGRFLPAAFPRAWSRGRPERPILQWPPGRLRRCPCVRPQSPASAETWGLAPGRAPRRGPGRPWRLILWIGRAGPALTCDGWGAGDCPAGLPRWAPGPRGPGGMGDAPGPAPREPATHQGQDQRR